MGEPGDIHFVVQEKDHDKFKRKGADLLLTKEVTLKEALCGFSWRIKQLDGRELLVKTRPGEVIKPEMNTKESLPFVKMVANEGMPSRGNPFVKGNLYILFRVKFPEDNELSPEQINALRSILSGLRQFGKGGAAQGNQAYDSDDEEGDGRAVQ